jgi:hypothetical protein
MNTKEFRDWIAFHYECFPEMRRWIDQTESPTKTLDAWREALSDCDMGDCFDASKAMLAGDLEPPAAYDRERLPGMIRKFCKVRRSERMQRAKDREILQSASRSGKCQPIGPLLREARELGFAKRDGEITDEEHELKLADIIQRAGTDPKAPEPRYSCPTCNDSGVVLVWHPREVDRYRRFKRTPRRLGAAVSCRCPNAKKAPDTFDDRFHFPLRFGTPTPKEQEQMKAWVDQTARRHSDFDDWGGDEIL